MSVAFQFLWITLSVLGWVMIISITYFMMYGGVVYLREALWRQTQSDEAWEMHCATAIAVTR